MKKPEMIKEVIKKYECLVENSSLSRSKYLPQLFDLMVDENDLKILINLPGNSCWSQ